MSLSATDSEIATRWYVLLSNVLFFAPAAYLVYMAARYQLYDRIVHAVLVIFVAVASFLYHLCSSLDSPGDANWAHTCVAPLDTLNLMDQTVSVATLANALCYAPPKYHEWIRQNGLLASFLFIPYFANSSTGIYVFTAILAILILVARLSLRTQRPDAVYPESRVKSGETVLNWFPTEGTWYYLFLALVLGALGLGFYIADNYSFYWYYHPTWHACEALALLFWFIWMDTIPAEPDIYSNSYQKVKNPYLPENWTSQDINLQTLVRLVL